MIVGQVGGGLGSSPTTTASPSHVQRSRLPDLVYRFWRHPAGYPMHGPTSGCFRHASGPGAARAVHGHGSGRDCARINHLDPTHLAANLKPGTYLLESGTHPSIQVPMGLIGMLVVTTAPAGTTAGTAYPAVTATAKTAAIPAVSYNAEVPLEFSEIDPVQNKEVDLAVRTAGFSETTVWSGLPTEPAGYAGLRLPGVKHVSPCYPPAVNYTPFYYLINGQAFDKTNPGRSLFAATAGQYAQLASPVTTGIPPPAPFWCAW